MAAVDDLRFEEFGDAAASLAANSDTTTISIEDPGDTPKHQPGPPGGSGREEDDELLGNDDSDKTELLAGQKKSSPFWTFEYYQTFFDVDTYQVFDRIKGSLLPVPGKNFVRLYVRSNPDLYDVCGSSGGVRWKKAACGYQAARRGRRVFTYFHILPEESPSAFRCIVAWVSQTS